jgi:DNA-binding transcriptional MocR family regulator
MAEQFNKKISFAPGRVFTQHNQYNNCMRLNFALEWSDKIDADLKRLGNIVKSELKSVSY